MHEPYSNRKCVSLGREMVFASLIIILNTNALSPLSKPCLTVG